MSETEPDHRETERPDPAVPAPPNDHPFADPDEEVGNDHPFSDPAEEGLTNGSDRPS